MKLSALYRAVFHDEREPPKGVILSAMSQAVQTHECAIARLNRVACDALHGKDCRCCEIVEGKAL